MDAAIQCLIEEIHGCETSFQLLSVLNALIDVLDKKPQLKAKLSESKIIDFLFVIIEHPERHLQKAHALQEYGSVTCDTHYGFFGNDQADICSLIQTSALKCILRVIDKLKFNESYVEILISLLNPEAILDKKGSQIFYRFTSNFTQALNEVLNESLGSEVKARNVEQISQASLFSELKVYEPELAKLCPIVLTQIPMFLYSLEVQSADEMSIGSVADILVSEGVAWNKNRLKAKMPLCGSKAKKSGENTSKTNSSHILSVTQDVVILKIMNGNFVWILMGKEMIQKVSRIHDMLKAEEDGLQHSALKSMDNVAARIISSSGTKLIIRCHILAVEQKFATVFGLDIGGLYCVHERDVFKLPSTLDLKVIAPQVAIGRLKDLLPMPRDPVVVELAAATLSKACRFNSSWATAAMAKQVLPALPYLIGAPDSNVAKQALSLAANLLLKSIHRCGDDWLNIILVTLDMVNQFIIRHESDQTKSCPNSQLKDSRLTPVVAGQSSPQGNLKPQEGQTPAPMARAAAHSHFPTSKHHPSKQHALTYASLLVLANFVHMSPQGKDYFYHQNGLETVLRVYLLMKANHHIRNVALHLLANFIHVNSKSQLMRNQLSACEKQGLKPLSSVSAPGVQCHGLEEDDDEAYEDLYLLESEDLVCDSLGAAHGGERDGVASKNKTGVEACSMEEEGTANKGNARTKAYVRDMPYPFANDPSYELQLNINLKADFLASIMCGMLNTGHGGTITLGVSDEDQRVRGVKLSHDLRENLRGGIKDIMDFHLQPRLLYPQLDIRFVPVTSDAIPSDEDDGSGDSGGAVYSDVYVVEISCQPLPGVVYSCKDNQSFYRFGFKTGPLNKQDIRHLVVIEEEAVHRETIQELQAIIKNLKADLPAS